LRLVTAFGESPLDQQLVDAALGRGHEVKRTG
jgi:hypothetical protein